MWQWELNLGGYTSEYRGSEIRAIASGRERSLFILRDNGALYRWDADLQAHLIDLTVFWFRVNTDGTLTISDWFNQNLPDEIDYTPGAALPFTVFNPWGINGDGGNIWGRFTANAAALQAYFHGGGWTGGAARVGLAAEEVTANVFGIPSDDTPSVAHNGVPDPARPLLAPAADLLSMARALLTASSKQTSRTERAPSSQGQRLEELPLALHLQYEDDIC